MSTAFITAIATVTAALVSAGAAIIVSAVNNNANHRRFMAELEKQNALQEFRLKQLEDKVDQHNHLDRRIVALEEQVKTLFNRAE